MKPVHVTFDGKSEFEVVKPRGDKFFLIPEKYVELRPFIESLTFSFSNKTLTLNIAESPKLKAMQYLLNMTKDGQDNMTLVFFDSKGEQMGRCLFKNCKLESHQCSLTNEEEVSTITKEICHQVVLKAQTIVFDPDQFAVDDGWHENEPPSYRIKTHEDTAAEPGLLAPVS